MKKIKLVLGPICSGKTTWCTQQLVTDEMTDIPSKYIKVSDIVKELSSANTRSELQDTADLDKSIADKVIDKLDRELLHEYDVVYIDGIRQFSIMMAVINHFAISDGEEIQVDLVWLEVARDERRRRFESRRQPRDLDLTFNEADWRDYDLGLDEIEQFVKHVNIIK